MAKVPDVMESVSTATFLCIFMFNARTGWMGIKNMIMSATIEVVPIATPTFVLLRVQLPTSAISSVLLYGAQATLAIIPPPMKIMNVAASVA